MLLKCHDLLLLFFVSPSFLVNKNFLLPLFGLLNYVNYYFNRIHFRRISCRNILYGIPVKVTTYASVNFCARDLE